MKKNKKFTRYVVTAMLCAVSFVLYLLEFPLFPGATHLKLDLSDIPALVGAMLYGPGWGVLVELVKNVIELCVKGIGSQMGFGNLMNFIVTDHVSYCRIQTHNFKDRDSVPVYIRDKLLGNYCLQYHG